MRSPGTRITVIEGNTLLDTRDKRVPHLNTGISDIWRWGRVPGSDLNSKADSITLPSCMCASSKFCPFLPHAKDGYPRNLSFGHVKKSSVSQEYTQDGGPGRRLPWKIPRLICHYHRVFYRSSDPNVVTSANSTVYLFSQLHLCSADS